MRRYHIQNRDDYKKCVSPYVQLEQTAGYLTFRGYIWSLQFLRYNKVCGIITKLVSVIKRLGPHDPTRIELTEQVLDKCAILSRLVSMHIP